MSMQNSFEDDLLELLFLNTALPNIGDASGLQPSATAGSWYVSLHTALPGEAVSDQTQDEATYTSYARQAVARNASAWTVASGVVDNDAAITFPQATGGSETLTAFGLGFAATLAGDLKMVGELTSSLAVSNGITPEFAAGDLDVSAD